MENIGIRSYADRKTFKYFTLLSVLYVTIVLLTILVENRVITFGLHFKILAGTLVLPLSYAISDIITEVYGYNQMKRLIWTSIVALFFSAAVIYIITLLPSDDPNTSAYDIVFGAFMNDVFTYSIAAGVSIFLNAYILAKWKILLQGRHFWLRSLGSTCIGEAIFITVWALIGFSYKFPLLTLLNFMLISYLYKLAYNLLAIYPTALIAAFLKNSEQTDSYDTNLIFNPFKLINT